MTKNPSAIPKIANQHTEEAAFLWLLRNNAITEAHYDLNHLSDLENRLEAHLDGLRIAEQTGWELALENLQQFPESGEMFTAATLAFESDDTEKLQAVYKIAETNPETERGLISALGWVDSKYLSGKVSGMLDSANPFWRRIGIAACAIHRVDPGKYLDKALEDENSALSCRAMKAVGELGKTEKLPLLTKHFSSENPEQRFWAAWAATLTGDHLKAPKTLQSFLSTPGKKALQASQLIFRVNSLESCQSLLGGLAKNPESLRLAIQGTGISGDSRYIPWLIQQMETPAHARVAGEAFSLITGVDLAWNDLETDQPEGFEAGPTESAEDDNTDLDPDENLPWPEPISIQQWWQQHQTDFPVGPRYLMGQVISADQCTEILKSGYQRQRMAAALEKAILQPEEPLFEIRSKTIIQNKSLSN
ncbi:MAG: TIGR02270 family protein [Thiolinea sp.]